MSNGSEAATRQLKQRVRDAIDARAEDIGRVAEEVLRNAELGYREERTSAIVRSVYDELGVGYEHGLGLTGIKTVLEGEAGPGPTVAILGELDALPIPDHPDANPATGAAHACGHNAQTAMVIAAAYGLLDATVLPSLAGRVALVHLPAEELVDLDYRLDLKRQGRIRYLVGKPELVRLGAFDDVDMAMMVHNTGTPSDLELGVGSTLNGAIMKTIRFRGRAAHAGASPHRGVNALKAANLAFQAIEAQRETFQDDDAVRVHWIVTRGGDAVNVVPSQVEASMFVRAKTAEAMADANEKVDRALRAGAMALGASVDISTLPGYMPISPYPDLDDVFRRNAVELVGEHGVVSMAHKGGSTDLGDLSAFMPAIHPFTGGASGNAHATDWHAGSLEDAVLRPAKAMAMSAIDLLAEGARGAQHVLEASSPPMTKDGYLAFLQALETEETYAPAATEGAA
jgi:amidohydrolase